MRAAGQLRNGSPPTSTTPPNNLAPHDSLFLGSAGRWPVAFGSLPNALIAAHNSVQNTSQGFAASCRELQASGLRSPERPGGLLRKIHLCQTADVLPLVICCVIMKKKSGAIIYSPSDLIRYLASPFDS